MPLAETIAPAMAMRAAFDVGGRVATKPREQCSRRIGAERAEVYSGHAGIGVNVRQSASVVTGERQTLRSGDNGGGAASRRRQRSVRGVGGGALHRNARHGAGVFAP